jgi:hypothetical protein
VETFGRCLPPESGNFCTLFYSLRRIWVLVRWFVALLFLGPAQAGDCGGSAARHQSRTAGCFLPSATEALRWRNPPQWPSSSNRGLSKRDKHLARAPSAYSCASALPLVARKRQPVACYRNPRSCEGLARQLSEARLVGSVVGRPFRAIRILAQAQICYRNDLGSVCRLIFSRLLPLAWRRTHSSRIIHHAQTTALACRSRLAG